MLAALEFEENNGLTFAIGGCCFLCFVVSKNIILMFVTSAFSAICWSWRQKVGSITLKNGRKEELLMSIQFLFIRLTLSVKITLVRPKWLRRNKKVSSLKKS